MPAPAALTPFALAAIRYGAVAALTYAVARRRAGPPREVRERGLDDLSEGVEFSAGRQGEELRADGGLSFGRDIRLGANGPGLAVSVAGLGRARIRPLGPRGSR